MKPSAPQPKSASRRRCARLEKSSRHLSGLVAACLMAQRRWAQAPKNTMARPAMRNPGATIYVRIPRYGFVSPFVKSIQTSSANENSAPSAITAPIALIQLLKLDRDQDAGPGDGDCGVWAMLRVRQGKRCRSKRRYLV